MPTIDTFTKRAARFKTLAAKSAAGDKKDPARVRHYRKLTKRMQRRARLLRLRVKAVEKPATPPAEAAPAEAKS